MVAWQIQIASLLDRPNIPPRKLAKTSIRVAQTHLESRELTDLLPIIIAIESITLGHVNIYPSSLCRPNIANGLHPTMRLKMLWRHNCTHTVTTTLRYLQ
jgi:hypothetical protein